jgi:short-subunit dehydrogenase
MQRKSVIPKNRTLAITGATAGIGRSTALEFAQQGYNVGLIARGQDGLEETRKEVEAFGVKALGIAADVAKADEVAAAAERIAQELGPIDVWINSAMVTVFAPVDKITPEEYKDVTDITYLGYVHGTLTALKHMKPRNRGCIVQVGSALAYRSIPLQSAYCGAKAAIRGFTDSLRSELIHDKSNIKVTMVQLPAHNTPQFDWARNKLGKIAQPLAPIYQPEVAARAIYRAAHQAPRELWVGRNTLLSIIGTGFIPSLLDRLLATKAYSGQKGDKTLDSREEDGNLEHPVPELHQEHGRFGSRAKDSAISVSQETVECAWILAGTGVVAAVAGMVLKKTCRSVCARGR